VTVVDLLLQISLGIAFSAWVVRTDMRRATPEQYARSWNDASFWSAVVAFHPLCILVHFARTRRSWLGLLLGILWMLLVVVALWLVSEVVEFVGSLCGL
jgi:hypothetical protein